MEDTAKNEWETKKYTKNDLYEACFKTLRWGSDEKPSEQERVEFAEYFNEIIENLGEK